MTPETPTPTLQFANRRRRIGPMVVVSMMAAVILVVLLQVWAFQARLRWDITRGARNSLNAGTTHLLEDLPETIRLVSLYAQGDPEDPAQQRYRDAVHDLLRRYAQYQPGLVHWSWINPLREQAEVLTLVHELRGLPRFAAETQAYEAAIADFTDRYHPGLQQTLQTHIAQLKGPGSVETVATELDDVVTTLEAWLARSADVLAAVQPAADPPSPPLRQRAERIEALYSDLIARIGNFSTAYLVPQLEAAALPPGARQTFAALRQDLDSWVTTFQGAATRLAIMPPPAFDRVSQTIQQGNAIVVITPRGAEALPFDQVWPALSDRQFPDPMDFEAHRFAGESSLTPAIVRLIQNRRTAVIFARFAGEGLFSAGRVTPERIIPPGPLSVLKDELERVNFVVAEWDVRQAPKPPSFEPQPDRTIIVVLRPGPSSSGGTPRAGDAITPAQRAAVLEAVGASGRALFLTGWERFSSGYEYDGYLETQWGIDVDGSALIVSALPIGPNEWTLSQNFHMLTGVSYADHEAVRGLDRVQPTVVPLATPLRITTTPPADVALQALVTTTPSDDVWAVADVDAFLESFKTSVNDKGQNFVRPQAGATREPFPLAVTAQRGEGRVVVMACGPGIANDELIRPQTVVYTNGYYTRRMAPGNFALFMNTLHYLNDSLQWRDATSALDDTRLAVDPRAQAWWQFILVGLWPLVALAGGLFAWYVRRR